jgi:glycerophosphoryl diester phosphodiesterase
MALRELQSLDAGSWWGSDFAGAQVPTLLEVLELTRKQIGLAIEIKAGSSRYPGIEATLAQLLQHTGRLDDVIIISADCRAIQAVRRLERRLATACFRHGSPWCWRWYRWLGLAGRWHSDYLFAWPEQVTPAVVSEVHRSGLKIITSLERTPRVNVAEVRRLADIGVDGIIADDVALLRQLLTERTR